MTNREQVAAKEKAEAEHERELREMALAHFWGIEWQQCKDEEIAA